MPCVRATVTLTLALPKVGLLSAPGVVGALYVADISVPPFVFEQVGATVGQLFDKGTIVPFGSVRPEPHTELQRYA